MRLLAVVVLASILLSRACFANDLPPVDAFEPYGEHVTVKTNGGSCTVELTLDEAKFIAAIPELQKLEILNPDITQTGINTLPYRISMTFALLAVTGVTPVVYIDDNSLDHCNFIQYISDVDDYGKNTKETMFTYSFDRALEHKINWDNLKTMSFPKVSKNFKFSATFMAKLRDE